MSGYTDSGTPFVTFGFTDQGLVVQLRKAPNERTRVVPSSAELSERAGAIAEFMSPEQRAELRKLLHHADAGADLATLRRMAFTRVRDAQWALMLCRPAETLGNTVRQLRYLAALAVDALADAMEIAQSSSHVAKDEGGKP